jgi:hypothetical protein
VSLVLPIGILIGQWLPNNSLKLSRRMVSVFKPSSAQQSVHLTLGILRQSQAVFYALAFFWLDGFAVPAPAQVTQAVR